MSRRLVFAVVAAVWTTGASANDIVRGGEVYRQHCASCHGARGISTWPGAPNIARREGLMQPDLAVVERIRSGRNAMPGYRGILSDRDMLSVVAYMRTLAQ